MVTIEVDNPIPELLSDELFMLLDSHDLFDTTKIRNYKMRKEYKSLREMHLKQCDAIELMLKDYPYLQFESIKKIVVSGERRKS
jgi:hypothetical protein